MKFVALDFETSGLDSNRNAPIMLGAAVFEDGHPCQSFESLIGPPTGKDGKITREYDVAALEISGQTWASVKEAPKPEAVLRQFRNFCKDVEAAWLPVVAFNAPFDFAFYSSLLFLGGAWNQLERRFETFPPPLAGPWHCARLTAIQKLGMGAMDKWNLDSVAKHFGLSRTGDSHGALEDAILAGRVFHALMVLGS